MNYVEVNYLKLIAGFWAEHDNEPFSGTEVLFYLRLAHRFNEAGRGKLWPESLQIKDSALSLITGISVNNLVNIRRSLNMRNMIEFSTCQGSRKGVIYRLTSLNFGEVTGEVNHETDSTSPIFGDVSGEVPATSPDFGEVSGEVNPTSPKIREVTGEVDATSPKSGEVIGEVNHSTISTSPVTSQELPQNLGKSHIYIEYQTLNTKQVDIENIEGRILPFAPFSTSLPLTGTSSLSVSVSPQQQQPAQTPPLPPVAPPPHSPVPAEDPPPKPKPKPPTLEERKEAFIRQLREYYKANRGRYPDDMYTKFISYWTEHNENGKKMRFEKQPTFNIATRLSTWHGKSDEFTTAKTTSASRVAGPKIPVKSEGGAPRQTNGFNRTVR